LPHARGGNAKPLRRFFGGQSFIVHARKYNAEKIFRNSKDLA
jgi:hypothetical protein